MNFIPRAVAKRTVTKGFAAPKKGVPKNSVVTSNASQRSSFSTSASGVETVPPHQIGAERRISPGKDESKDDDVSSVSRLEDTSVAQDERCLEQVTSSTPGVKRVPPHQFCAEKITSPGKDDSKDSEVSSACKAEDTGFKQGGRCSELVMSSCQAPADVEKVPSASGHCTAVSHLAKDDESGDGSKDACRKNPGRTSRESHDRESHENKLERLQALSNRISSQVSVLKENSSTPGHAKSTDLPQPAACSAPMDEDMTGSHQDGYVHHNDPDGEGSDGEEDPPSIVSFSKNQRWPEDDEPVCVVCGKYGEYICNQTEADVCSLECKAKNLVRRGLQSNVSQMGQPPEEIVETSSMSSSHDATRDSGILEEETEKPYIYKEHSDISQLSAEQVQDIRNEVQIFVEGMNVPRPILEFEQLHLPAKLQNNLHSSDYVTPTPIQMQAIPACLSLRDLMMCAQTSSGKTLSFLVPAVITIYNQVVTGEGNNGPFVLILTPTRELAMQIEEQAKQLMKGMSSMKTALLVGGLPLPPQLHRLRQNIQLIVGTPGRILEIIRQEGVSLGEMKLVVTDEVDTMLQLGFQQQVYDILSRLPDHHQTIFTSATIPSSIERMASSLLNNPIFISVGTPSTPCTSVRQVILWVEEPSKKKKLFAILQDPKHFRPPAIVFVDSKLGADLLAQAVEKSCGLSVASLHGDKPQSQRNEILRSFRDGSYDVVISTAVLGRGIDLPGVKMVINFDMPGTVEEYIHQIGRTGRLGTAGTAMTFINNSSKKLFLQFTSILKPLGVTLPPELVNSPHLSYYRQQHRSRDRQMDALQRVPGGSGYHRSKRTRDGESVTDILKKRKRKFKP